jgi:DNA-directed RNA polymerase specialized sigma24 family protein
MGFPRRTTEETHQKQGHATASDVGRVFTDYRQELEWLALFLTGDEKLVEACLVDARTLATTENQVFEEWLEHWARRATINSAAGMQQSRIRQLAATYERRPCLHGEHGPLPSESAELLKLRSPVLTSRLDVLCRFALVLRGIERYSTLESALMLGVGKVSLEAAYCAALESVTTLECELIDQLDETCAET